MNKIFDETTKLYSLLQDDLSKKIFWERLAMDVECTLEHATELSSLRSSVVKNRKKWKSQFEDLPSTLRSLKEQGNNIIIYGTAVCGQQLSRCLRNEHIEFTGFCGRHAENYSDGLMGKPVYSPEWLFDHAENTYVIIAAAMSFTQIRQVLVEHHFPEDHIIKTYQENRTAQDTNLQYFEFPELYPGEGAFIDGGSFDGADSIHFASWCNHNYSSIVAFEPDAVNCEKTKKNFEKAAISNSIVLQAGVGKADSTAQFCTKGSVGSHVVSINSNIHDYQDAANVKEIQIRSVDSIAQETNQKISMIKLDIEGAEMDALQGAANSIQRDHPLLAISVYHKPGDVLEIMEYCMSLVPQYKFWLRQYECVTDTILYAAVI